MKDYEPKIYLNNAATSWPKPDCVAGAMAEALENLPGDAGRGGIRDFHIFDQVRKELADLMGIGCPERIALGSNSTWGLNQAVFGFPFKLLGKIVDFCVYPKTQRNAACDHQNQRQKQRKQKFTKGQ